MTDMPRASKIAFVNDFAHYHEQAERCGAVIITDCDRTIGGYLSAKELNHYGRLKALQRQVLKVGELSDKVMAEIMSAEYGVKPN